MSREAAELAREAAQYIQEHGMCKNELFTSDGQVCLWGAIKKVAKLDMLTLGPIEGSISSTHRRDVVALRTALQKRFPGEDAFPGSDFNDLPDTTERDVAKVLLQVADELELQ